MHPSQNILLLIKSRKISWAAPLSLMGVGRELRTGIWKGNLKEISLGKPRRRWEDNIERDLKGIELESMGWTDNAQRRSTWRAVVNTTMNLRVPYSAGNFLTS